MRKPLILVLFLFMMVAGTFAGTLVCAAADQPPPEGGVLPEIKLSIPQNSEDIQYLGIKEKKQFKIPQIQADLVILEIFSMYCPFCQKEAPAVNELYQIIGSREDLKNRVKIIGIGAGNSSFEVDTFKKHYGVPFPLFPDSDYSIHKAVGQVRTPYFLGVRVNKDGSHKVIYSKLGSFGDPQQFLELVLNKSGLK